MKGARGANFLLRNRLMHLSMKPDGYSFRKSVFLMKRNSVSI